MIVNKVKNFFCKRSTKWEDKYEEKRKECDNWEFKFNKLHRQLQAILEEASK
jgi:hypothetical protein